MILLIISWKRVGQNSTCSRIPWRANIVLEVTFPEATFSKQVSKITIFLLFSESETKEVSGYAPAEKLGGWLDDLLDA